MGCEVDHDHTHAPKSHSKAGRTNLGLSKFGQVEDE